jgi:hypothetical protein
MKACPYTSKPISRVRFVTQDILLIQHKSLYASVTANVPVCIKTNWANITRSVPRIRNFHLEWSSVRDQLRNGLSIRCQGKERSTPDSRSCAGQGLFTFDLAGNIYHYLWDARWISLNAALRKTLAFSLSNLILVDVSPPPHPSLLITRGAASWWRRAERQPTDGGPCKAAPTSLDTCRGQVKAENWQTCFHLTLRP